MEKDQVTETAANGHPLGRCLSSFVDQGRGESHRYYLARRTLLEMLHDRGYVVAQYDLNQSLDGFREAYTNNPDTERLSISSAHRSDPSKRIMAIFCGLSPVKKNVIRGIGSMIANKDGLSSLILVLQSDITSQAKKEMELWSFKVEMFQITALLVNITKHVLKPKHRVLNKDEKKHLLKKYSIQEKQLPRMLLTDAIARYYCLEKGQVVKITYSGEITGSHVTYRCVW